MVDAISGHHLWAEQYDRNLEDLFALQVKLTEGEQARVYDRVTGNLDSLMKVLESSSYLSHLNKADDTMARQMIEEVIPLEPENAGAYTLLGSTYLMDVWYGSSASPE